MTLFMWAPTQIVKRVIYLQFLSGASLFTLCATLFSAVAGGLFVSTLLISGFCACSQFCSVLHILTPMKSHESGHRFDWSHLHCRFFDQHRMSGIHVCPLLPTCPKQRSARCPNLVFRVAKVGPWGCIESMARRKHFSRASNDPHQAGG